MKRVLVIDDQQSNRDYLKTVLQAAEYKVFEASDGAEALHLARTESPDLVVADILMPRMDGCEFVRRLRSEPPIAGIPVIFLTAHYLEQDLVDLAEACGVYRIITKPVEPQTILHVVRKAMRQSATSMRRDAMVDAGDKHLRLLTDTLARKAELLETSNRRLDALVQLGQKIAAEHDPRRLLTVFCSAAGDILGARCALVAVSEDDGRTLRHVTGNGIDPQLVGRLTSPRVVAQLFKRCMPLSSARLLGGFEAAASDVELPKEFGDMGKVLLAPVETGSRTYGMVCMVGVTLDHENDASAMRVITSMGAVLGVAYENAIRYEQIETHATRMRVEVNERIRAQKQVELANEHLEQRVAERTRELEESHAQLRQAERMASMGTLCAGLGHDMGNILLPIRARLQALQQVGMAREGQEHVQAIGKYIEYLQNLTNGLRMLAVDSTTDANVPPLTDLSQWYQDAQPLLRSPLTDRMHLTAKLPASPVAVKLGRHQLTQAIYNLVHNAADAMRSGRDGRIEIAAELIDGGEWVRCTVSDNGPGMPEDVRARAAEPFFTTKHREFSTGLGLSLVRGIVTAVGGTLSIESEPGRGTRIQLEIPAAPKSPCKAADAASSDGPAACVALADARLRALAICTLRDLGYENLPACAGDHVPPAEHPDAAVWLIDASQAHRPHIEAYLAAADHRVLVVRGAIDIPGAQASSPHQNVIQLQEHLRPSEFCALLRDRLKPHWSHHARTDRHSVCR